MSVPEDKTHQSTLTPIAYNDLVDKAELIAIRLVSSTFKLEPDAYARREDSWKQSYGCELERSIFEEGEDFAFGYFDASATIKIANKKILTLKSKYIIFYDVNGAPSSLAVDEFIKRVGKFAVYPYFRAHFAEVCSQAGLNVQPLPIMREGPRQIPRVPSQTKEL
jgi:hypothetical protein